MYLLGVGRTRNQLTMKQQKWRHPIHQWVSQNQVSSGSEKRECCTFAKTMEKAKSNMKNISMHSELPALLTVVNDGRVWVLVWLTYTDQCLVKHTDHCELNGVRHANSADTKPRENNLWMWLFLGWMLKSSDSKINTGTIKLKETGQWYDKHEWQINQNGMYLPWDKNAKQAKVKRNATQKITGSRKIHQGMGAQLCTLQLFKYVFLISFKILNGALVSSERNILFSMRCESFSSSLVAELQFGEWGRKLLYKTKKW